MSGESAERVAARSLPATWGPIRDRDRIGRHIIARLEQKGFLVVPRPAPGERVAVGHDGVEPLAARLSGDRTATGDDNERTQR